jgi:hypothetical protein
VSLIGRAQISGLSAADKGDEISLLVVDDDPGSLKFLKTLKTSPGSVDLCIDAEGVSVKNDMHQSSFTSSQFGA